MGREQLNNVGLGTRLIESHTSTVCSMSTSLVLSNIVICHGIWKFSYSLTTMSSWTGRRGREEVLTLPMSDFSSSEKLESSIITESGEPCCDRQVRLHRNCMGRRDPLYSVCQWGQATMMLMEEGCSRLPISHTAALTARARRGA